MTADRDKWRDLSRSNMVEIRRLHRRVDELEPVAARHEALMQDLAAHLVPALEDARFVQVNPAGIPTKRRSK